MPSLSRVIGVSSEARRLLRWLVVAATGLLLAGCDPFSKPATMMDEYVERVARVLDVEARTSALPVLPTLPRRRLRTRALPELDIGILEFFSLYGCELQQLVGRKNSALGKVMQPAQRLEYEIRFIQAAHECLPTLTDESLRQALAGAVKVKREALPLAVWNATWGTTEMADFFTRSDGYLPIVFDADDLRTLAAELSRLNAWLGTLAGTERPEMIDDLSEIHQRWQALPLAGQLVQSARLLTARLRDVGHLLERRLEGRPLCFNQRPNREAEIMRNLFFNVYAKRVQPYMVSVQRARARLLPPLGELARQQKPAMGPAFEPFFESVLQEESGTIWAALDEATRQHTEHWQALLDQCGMRPQA